MHKKSIAEPFERREKEQRRLLPVSGKRTPLLFAVYSITFEAPAQVKTAVLPLLSLSIPIMEQRTVERTKAIKHATKLPIGQTLPPAVKVHSFKYSAII